MFYDKTMRHIEMHLIESPKDVETVKKAGLEVGDNESCEECLTPVGDSHGKTFTPFVFILDDEAEWVVCKECAMPGL